MQAGLLDDTGDAGLAAPDVVLLERLAAGETVVVRLPGLYRPARADRPGHRVGQPAPAAPRRHRRRALRGDRRLRARPRRPPGPARPLGRAARPGAGPGRTPAAQRPAAGMPWPGSPARPPSYIV